MVRRPSHSKSQEETLALEALEPRLALSAPPSPGLSEYEIHSWQVINYMREDPNRFANELVALYNGTATNAHGYAGSDPVWTDIRERINLGNGNNGWTFNDMLNFLAAQPSLDPLYLQADISQEAYNHVVWMSQHGFAHTGASNQGSSIPGPGFTNNPAASADAYDHNGSLYGFVAGENISWGAGLLQNTKSAYNNGQITLDGFYQRLAYADTMISFVLDIGIPSLGHLRNLLARPGGGGFSNFDSLGIDQSFYESPGYEAIDGVREMYVTTHRFAHTLSDAERVGQYIDISFNDTNGNGFYDAGEIFQLLTAPGMDPLPPGGVVLNDPPGAAAPIAVADTFITSDTSSFTATVSVLANDSDADGDPMRAQLVSGPQNGTLTLFENGIFQYTANANFWGLDSFTYFASDGVNNSQVVQVTLYSHAAALVEKLYNQVLGRGPEGGGWEYWSRNISAGSATVGDIAAGIFHSAERLDPIIADYYRTYLLREPDASGIAYWRGIWQSNGSSDPVVSGIVSSPEFFQSAGGTNRLWVTEVYNRLLQRGYDNAGLDFWTNLLDTGQATRESVVLGFEQSAEKYGILVDGWFGQYLYRLPNGTERDLYINQLLSGATHRSIQTQLINSTEYLSNPNDPADGTANFWY
ncbi:Hypothetical protein PBC10988_31780 [Planctomycetales bacterium 10988]|nr:Hypothetical protein PBC10988_31780 [Planctomycetales bacterium 10988]